MMGGQISFMFALVGSLLDYKFCKLFELAILPGGRENARKA